MRLLLRFLPLAALPLGLVIGLACQKVTAPAVDDADVAPGAASSLALTAIPPDPIFPVQLRASPGDPISKPKNFGFVQFSFLAAPPDPIIPAACVVQPLSTTPGMTAAAICGRIQNPDGQTFLSGMVFAGSLTDPSASVRIGGFPTDVQTLCSQITLRGTLLLPDAFATAFRQQPTSFSLAFSSLQLPAALIGKFGPRTKTPIDITPSSQRTVSSTSATDVPIGGCTVDLHSF